MTLLFLGYLLLGALAGVLAGLFGIGGGLVVVPVLIIAFEQLGLAGSVLTHLAIGTSLATIIVTSCSAIRAHHRRGAVAWGLFRRLTPGLVVGTWIGAAVAVWLSGAWLQGLFGCFALVLAVKFWTGWAPPAAQQTPKSTLMTGAGLGIGCASSIFGIGGGTLTVPLLRRFGVPMQEAVGTSSACGLPIALMGTLAHMLLLWNHPDLPPWAFGSLYLPAFIGIVLASVPGARLGAQMAHRLPGPLLQRGFAVLLLAVALKLLLL